MKGAGMDKEEFPEFLEPREVAEMLCHLVSQAESLPPELTMWIGIAAGTLLRLDEKGRANG